MGNAFSDSGNCREKRDQRARRGRPEAVRIAESERLTLDKLHAYLKTPKPTFYSLAQNGRIPAAKVGKHWRFRRAEIEEWFTAQQRNRPLSKRTRSVTPSDVIH